MGLSLEEYAHSDAHDLMDLLRLRDVSAEELCACANEAIDALNPQLNFLVGRVDADEIGNLLAELNPSRPFGGLPFLVKEGVGMKGQPLLMASRMAPDVTCAEDSELIKRLKDAGVIVLGSTNVPEFGSAPTTESVLHGPSRNPWDLTRMSGGSSGGSAAAVAAGVVPVAQAADGGGSIRTPAHCCGIFGLKPSRGRTPVGPGSYSEFLSLSVPHVVSRSVRDSAAFLDVLQGSEIGSPWKISPPKRPYVEETDTDVGELRIAFSASSLSGQPIHPDCVAAVETAARLCEQLGHKVEQTQPDFDWFAFRKSFVDLWASRLPPGFEEIERLIGRKPTPETLESSNYAMLEHGRSMTFSDLSRALLNMRDITMTLDAFHQEWDVYITPVALSPAVPLGQIDANAPGQTASDWFDTAVANFASFPPLFNVSGQPAMSVPLCQSADGLPIGIHCSAKYGDEATLIQLAAQMERAMPWKDRHPAISIFQSTQR